MNKERRYEMRSEEMRVSGLGIWRLCRAALDHYNYVNLSLVIRKVLRKWSILSICRNF